MAIVKEMHTDLSDKDLGTTSCLNEEKKAFRVHSKRLIHPFDRACVCLLDTMIQECDKSLNTLQIIIFRQLPKHVCMGYSCFFSGENSALVTHAFLTLPLALCRLWSSNLWF